MSEKAVLGEFEHHVLLATLRLGQDAYTTSILQELEERTGREISASAIYVALRRLEKNGLVTSALRTGEELGERRERRYFAATPAGVELVLEARRRLDRLWQDLEVGAAET